ncbi:MAG TPA: recombinase family protein [Actinomycetota bacterium]|nr:recombinase family protein [Actinomycetota bacterium]
MTRAAIYCRISRDPEDRHKGVDRQRADCLEIAERRGWTVVEEYIDNDVSAAEGTQKARRRYLDLLADIEAGKIDAVVMWAEDRLQRQLLELLEFLRICEQAGVTKLASAGGEYDMSNPDQRMNLKLKALIAEAEIEKMRMRMRRQRLGAAEDGEPHSGGSREFGTVGKRQVRDPETGSVSTVPIVSEGRAARERELIQKAAERVLAGDSLRAIRLDWKREGVRTASTEARARKGKPPAEFSNQALRKLLLSPRMVGYRVHQGRLYPGTWPAILDYQTWEAVGEVLRDPDRTSRRGGVPRHLLSGLLFGGDGCGHRLNSQPRNGKLLYRCRELGCAKITRAAAPIEALICEALFVAVESPEWDRLAERPADDPTRELHEQLARDQGLLDRLEDKVAEELIRPEAAKRKRAEIERRMDVARDKLGRLGDSRVAARVPRNLRDVWPNLSLDRRRSILAVVIERITVNPQKPLGPGGFDPDAIVPTWRA